ncbi:hypothetical protein IMCC21906_02367 [Spongiibacter sp. IMCC21906]|jgi:uncharacterized membrane protein YkoI|uniref:PepSY domain-containing protein n=1 Tax=Spongiibacter sp. IMCC21906 TaxID=1620392 RepID=UPI00062DCECF|nr:PepSY domain-containing protein [Spongiibacter sp. IMCC21906]AKH70027.1 hypothetical protein IMCC21906_02367 [Spongiibacter sp. IMCC21906]
MRYFQLTSILLGILLGFSAASYANPLQSLGQGGGIITRPNLNDRQLRPSQIQNSISSREAVSIAERRYNGRAVGVRQIQDRGGVAYKVRILQDNGKIKNVIIDGR